MHFTLQLDIQLIQLTDTRLNESQAPPKLWISLYYFFFLLQGDPSLSELFCNYKSSSTSYKS